jgi:hypothetical protein
LKKILYILIIIFIPAISLSAVIKNQGTKIFLNNNVFMKVVNLEMKNENSGSIIVRDTSELRVEGGDFINESGTVNLQDISILEVSENLINKGSYNNESSSHTIVKKNVVNSGDIYNASMIEIGE